MAVERSAIRWAFLLARSMRRPTVGRRPPSIQHSSGWRMVRKAPPGAPHFVNQVGFAPKTIPASMSLNPERYFVPE